MWVFKLNLALLNLSPLEVNIMIFHLRFILFDFLQKVIRSYHAKQSVSDLYFYTYIGTRSTEWNLVNIQVDWADF